MTEDENEKTIRLIVIVYGVWVMLSPMRGNGKTVRCKVSGESQSSECTHPWDFGSSQYFLKCLLHPSMRRIIHP